MPKGPKGEKRPADVIGAAVKVMKIATGKIEEDIDDDGKSKAAVELGLKGGIARAATLSPKRRKEMAIICVTNAIRPLSRGRRSPLRID